MQIVLTLKTYLVSDLQNPLIKIPIWQDTHIYETQITGIEEKEGRPTSVLSNFDVPLYEEVLGPKEGQLVRRSMSVTPGLTGIKCGEGARPKDSSKRMSAFQDYTSAMMYALNNPWKPQNKRTETPTWTAVPPLVYLSASGTPVGDTQTKKESDERYVPMNFSAVDKTILMPQGRQEMKGVASPIKFTEALQNGDALRVNPQGGALMEALGFGPEKVEEKDPDFYMPDAQGKKLSESYQMFTNEQTPEGNPGVIVKLSNLVKKYGTSFYLMDRKSGHLYVLDEKGYKQIEEKGLLYPSESMIIAGALDENRGNPFVIGQKVLNNRLSVIRTPAEKGKTNLQYEEYQRESKKLLDFCEKMMGKREKEADSIELEQPEGVPKVREISKEKLNEKLNEIIDQPQYVRPIGENTSPPYYSGEMSRYEPPNPIKQKEREDLLEKVREMTSEESKGSKGEKLVEVDTDLSWDHEGLRPLPKSHKDRLNGSPKLPRVPKGPKVERNNEGTFKKECPSFRGDYKEGKYPEPILKENKVGIVVPQEEKQVPEIDKKDGKNDERWDFESPGNLADKKTARWIEEQNEFLGKQEEKEFGKNRKERDPSVFEPSGRINVLQKQRANLLLGMNKYLNI